MKKPLIAVVVVTLVVALFTTGAIVYANELIYETPFADVDFAITKKTSQQEIDELKAQLKEQGVELEISELNYNAKGHIEEIKGTVKFENGGSGSFTAGKNFKEIRVTGNYGIIVKGGIRILVR